MKRQLLLFWEPYHAVGAYGLCGYKLWNQVGHRKRKMNAEIVEYSNPKMKTKYE